MLEIQFQAARFSCTQGTEGVFGSVLERPVLGMSLAERQERAILLAWGAWAHEESKAKLWIREDVYVTSEAIEVFVKKAKEKPPGVYCFKADGLFGGWLTDLMLGDTGPLMVWKSVGGPPSDEELEEAKDIIIPSKERVFPMPVSKAQFGADILQIPLSDFVVVPTRHWLQLLWCNLMGLAPFLWRELVGRKPVTAMWNLFKAFVRKPTFKFPVLFTALGRKGKGCQIHPSAVVEGSWLGEGVRIGANAVVRGCVLAEGAVVEDLALVEFSVLGEKALVQRQAMVKFSVLAARSAAAGVMQLGVLDQDAMLKRGAYLMDMRLGESAKIKVDGELRKAPLGLAGCCVGARTIVGLGVRVAAGRYIPPDLHIVAAPEQTLIKIPERFANRAKQDAEGEPIARAVSVKKGGLSLL